MGTSGYKTMGDNGFLRQGMDYLEVLPRIHRPLRMKLREVREAWIKLWLAEGNVPPVDEGKDSAIFYRVASVSVTILRK
jgi:hypothetical protein